MAQLVGSGPDVLGDPRFGLFGGRQDFDVMAYWTVLNFGIGNKARDQMRPAAGYAAPICDNSPRSTACGPNRRRLRQDACAVCSNPHVRAGDPSEHRGLPRGPPPHYGADRLPLEVVNSMRLLWRSRVAYTNAILDYDRAQFELYVALGKPPADVLVRPAGENGEIRPHESATRSPTPQPPPAPLPTGR